MSRLHNRPAFSTLLAVTTALSILTPLTAAHAGDDDHGRDRREVRREDKDIQKIQKDREKLERDRRNMRRDDRDHDTAAWNNRQDAWKRDNDRRDDRNDGWRRNDDRRDNNRPDYRRDNDRDDHYRPSYRVDEDRYRDNREDRDNRDWDRDRQVHQVDVYQDNRQDTKNQWRNLGTAAAAAAAYGILKHDPTIAFAGALGALYSAQRYEQDRKSQRAEDRARVGLFDQGWFERDGVRYTCHQTTRNGQKYYYFAR